MEIQLLTTLGGLFKLGDSFLVAEVQLDVGLFHFFNAVEGLELFFGQGVYDLVNHFSNAGFEVKPVDPLLRPGLVSLLDDCSTSTALIFIDDLN